MLKVFVYGTLKPGESNYLRLCAGKVLEEERAIAFGQLFDLPVGYPAMTTGDRPIQGYLLTFANPDLLNTLDDLEDYRPHRLLEENYYNRREIEIFAPDGQSLGLAWAYFMTVEKIKNLKGIPIPSNCWTPNRAVGEEKG